ncbi:MAG: hypothetical protein IJE14_04510 [Clostridia bacterium]|nr:hypothetical protein [Clostridia bacterium]
MKTKKFTALIIGVIAVLSLTGCGEKEEFNSPADNTTESVEQTVTQDITEENITENKSDETKAEESTDEIETAENLTEEAVDDISEWTFAQIADFYKNAAIKTNPGAKSRRDITLTSIDVNNGQYENVFEFITPIMSKILARNSTEVDGITGGFTKLSEADIKTAKAYKNGSNTVIEMTMKNQVAGPREDMNEGTVGHAMAVVGDIGVVVDQLKEYGLPMELSDKDTSIHYSNAKLKVTVDQNGRIISGKWSYTVDIRMNNYKVFGKDVETTSVVMVNTITLL